VRVKLVLSFLLVALATPAAAIAGGAHADFYVAPAPANPNGDCLPYDPCSLPHAFTKLGEADAVTINVGPGDYAISSTLHGNAQTVVTGMPGQARPRVIGPTASGFAFEFGGGSSEVDDLILEAFNGNGGLKNPSFVDHVVIDDADQGIYVDDTALFTDVHDTVISRFGDGITIAKSSGVDDSGVDLFNSSVASSVSGSTAVVLTASDTANTDHFSADSSSLRGEAGDITAAGLPAKHAKVYLRYSAFRPSRIALTNADIVTDDHNVKSEPPFAGLASGDLHEPAGSPTIDAGRTDSDFSSFDLDGAPRVQGQIDIGAYETRNPAATAVTPPGGLVTPSNAFTFGKQKNRADGSVDLTVVVPGPGLLTASDASNASATAAAKKKRKKRKPALVKRARKRATKAGKVTIHLKPTKAAKRKLRHRRSLKAKVKITFTPTGGKANSHRKTIKFKRAKHKRKKR
jgi:hypothetical protein